MRMRWEYNNFPVLAFNQHSSVAGIGLTDNSFYYLRSHPLHEINKSSVKVDIFPRGDVQYNPAAALIHQHH
jgi:hypothetical protein